MSKLRLYISTALHLKPTQIAYRLWRNLGGRTCLHVGYKPRPDIDKVDIGRIPALPELDFDPVFLARFDVDALLNDRVELLHHEERIDWCESWHAELLTPLWRFNLHYHEYLLPLAKAFLDKGTKRYLDKVISIIDSWIDACPSERGGVAWDSYVISMRIVNWLAIRAELADALAADVDFCKRMDASLVEQYVHLSQHLEKDLLANHYLEDLKALTILACYFDDIKTLEIVLPMLKAQVDEQVLGDGMHFELSPMYQKIVLEDLMRVAVVLQASGFGNYDEVFKLQVMCNCLYSLERGINRTPLFNDCGDNVAKSRDALLICARNHFSIEPVYHNMLGSSGYCILEHQTPVGSIKAIFDAGNPGPPYALGHVHCDALSFELFINGEAVIINRGTFSYQDKKRLDFKSTSSHSTVTISGDEQNECWGSFRIAKYGKNLSAERDGNSVEGKFLTPKGNTINRTVSLSGNGLSVFDKVIIKHSSSSSCINFLTNGKCKVVSGRCRVEYPNFSFSIFSLGCEPILRETSYAPEFGMEEKVTEIVFPTKSVDQTTSESRVTISIANS